MPGWDSRADTRGCRNDRARTDLPPKTAPRRPLPKWHPCPVRFLRANAGKDSADTATESVTTMRELWKGAHE